MEILIEFLIVFVICNFIYFFFVIRKYKKYEKNRNNMEVEYIIKKYKLDINKVNYKSMLLSISFVNSFIIASVVVVIGYVKGFLYQLLIGFCLLIPLILVCYYIVGKYYQNKMRKRGK